jgi:predicted ATPase
LRLAKRQADKAEADFRDSIALAKEINAKAWELRTSMSLARLLTSQGHADDARTLITESYSSFREGFDTADLLDAKCLLEDLHAKS